MLDGQYPMISSRLFEIISARLAKQGYAVSFDRNDNLSELGLTSLDSVGLMLSIEGEFDVEIPTEMLNPGQFRSMAAIERLVVSLTSPG